MKQKKSCEQEVFTLMQAQEKEQSDKKLAQQRKIVMCGEFIRP